jgi:hypothetical protein
MRGKIGALLREDAKDSGKSAPVAVKHSDDEGKEAPKDKPKEDKVVTLPEMRVVGKRVPEETETTREAKILIKDLEKKIEKEKKNTVPTKLDNVLNNGAISRLGDRSAVGAAIESKEKVKEMEVKQSVAAVAVDPNSEEENEKLLEMLKDLDYKQKEENNSRRSGAENRR